MGSGKSREGARVPACVQRCATPALVAFSLTLTACSLPTRPSSAANPLLAVSCPPLTPLADDTFGATTLKLIEVAGIYHRCRTAALALEGKK